MCVKKSSKVSAYGVLRRKACCSLSIKASGQTVRWSQDWAGKVHDLWLAYLFKIEKKSDCKNVVHVFWKKKIKQHRHVQRSKSKNKASTLVNNYMAVIVDILLPIYHIEMKHAFVHNWSSAFYLVTCFSFNTMPWASFQVNKNKFASLFLKIM